MFVHVAGGVQGFFFFFLFSVCVCERHRCVQLSAGTGWCEHASQAVIQPWAGHVLQSWVLAERQMLSTWLPEIPLPPPAGMCCLQEKEGTWIVFFSFYSPWHSCAFCVPLIAATEVLNVISETASSLNSLGLLPAEACVPPFQTQSSAACQFMSREVVFAGWMASR